MVPEPQDDRMDVIPNIIENGVSAAVFCVLNSGPPPPAFGTDHARRPIKVAPNAIDETMNGF